MGIARSDTDTRPDSCAAFCEQAAYKEYFDGRRGLLAQLSCSSTHDNEMTRHLDLVDEQILALLESNARMPVSEIARRVNLSSAPVARRVARMESDGVIQGYVTVVDRGRSGQLEAFTEIRLQGAAETSELNEILRDVPEVKQFFIISGDPDAIVRILVSDADHLQRVVNGLRRSGKIAGTKTLIVMTSWDRSGMIVAGASAPPS